MSENIARVILAKRKLFLLIFALGTIFNCSSTQKMNLEPPPDLNKKIQEIENDERIPFPVKQELAKALRESQDYASNCYTEYSKSQDQIAELKKANENLELQIATLEKTHEWEIEKLKKEIANWRKIKFWFWTIIAVVLLSILWKIFSPWLIPIVKKLLGIPI
jgi:hypothetical protein